MGHCSPAPRLIKRPSGILLVLATLFGTECLPQVDPATKQACLDRITQDVFSQDTVFIGKRFSVRGDPRKAYGRIHAIGSKFNAAGLYPGDLLGEPAKRMICTDTAFIKGSQHLLNGTFRFYHRNGNLRSEYEVLDGYMLSRKYYDRKGELAIWYDYSFDIDSCLFTCYVQQYVRGREGDHTIEWVYTAIDGRLGRYEPAYARQAMLRGWKTK